MNPHHLWRASIAQLSNTELLARVKRLTERERHATAVLVAHLAELDERRLYLAEGCGSLFASEDGFLEFHHVTPYAARGAATAENIQLRCRAHNAFEAVLDFGAAAVQVKESQAAYSARTESGSSSNRRLRTRGSSWHHNSTFEGRR